MEEDKSGGGGGGGGGTTSRVPATSQSITVLLLPAPPQTSASKPLKEPSAAPSAAGVSAPRQRFTVELRTGETTIVSWKKLVKESGQGGGGEVSPSRLARAELAPDIGPQPGPSGPGNPDGNDPTEAVQPTNRFSSVIEKIERLYMGKHSSDEEEELDMPDDDQYDTEDSFIDDTELDEYFQVDNLATKHSGYFVNKGKLEQIRSESGPSQDLAPKKRRRKENANTDIEKKKLPSGDYYYENAPKPSKNKIVPASGTHKRNYNYTEKDLPVLALESRDFERHKALAYQSNDPVQRPSGTNSNSNNNEIYSYNNNNNNNYYPVSREKPVLPAQIEYNTKKVTNGENDGKIRKEKHGIGEFTEPSTSGSVYPMQNMQLSASRVREGSAIKHKGTRLERAIRDLEKIVAECRPQSHVVQEADPTNPGTKRRLPQEVKFKLAKVARLAADLPEEETIDRLMGIVGHLVQRKTLKRNMREMVQLGLSAKQEKADRFQQIKKEINEMIRSRISYLKSKMPEQQTQDGSADDFQQIGYNEEKRLLKGKFSMDNALEDKICDLYDIYVEGMDEDKGPQSRKLYVELAELWPHGYMDNVGIKDAISRSKDRKRSLHNQRKVRNEERLKRKKLASQTPNPRPVQAVDYTNQTTVPREKTIPNPNPNPNPSAPPPFTVSAGQTIDYGQQQMVKKMKRKSESDYSQTRVDPTKVQSLHSKEKHHKSHKYSSSADEANREGQIKSNSNVQIQISGSALPNCSDQGNFSSVNFPGV